MIYGEHELDPILKKFFALSNQEWESFCQLMEQESALEQKIYIIELPRFGCYCPMLKNISKVMKGFSPITFYNYTTGSRKNDVLPMECMVVPSFSALQNYFKIKAEGRKRTAIKLMPNLGPLSKKVVEAMRRKGEGPLGIYYGGAPNQQVATLANNHMEAFDGWIGGEDIFKVHDLFHASCEQEMTEGILRGRFRTIDLLREYIPVDLDECTKVNQLIDVLLDGELLYSYGIENSPFKTARANESFGYLFYVESSERKQLWTDRMKMHIIKNMVNNADDWRNECNLGPDDLLEPERSLFWNFHRNLQDQ